MRLVVGVCVCERGRTEIRQIQAVPDQTEPGLVCWRHTGNVWEVLSSADVTDGQQAALLREKRTILRATLGEWRLILN